MGWLRTVTRWHIQPRRYQQLCAGVLAALVLIVATGGAVRLTGSGLGCTDWPTCSDDKFAPALEFHGLVEFVNRLFTGVVSLGVVAAVIGALFLRPRRRDLTVLALGLVAGVIGQIALGALLVLAKLDPRLTIGHFLLSMVLVGDAVLLHHRASFPDRPSLPGCSLLLTSAQVETKRYPLQRFRWLLLATAAIVLFAGTIVTGAGPHGGDDRAARLNIAVRSAVRVHSLLAWLLVAFAVSAAVILDRKSAGEAARRDSRRLVAAVAIQGGIGYVTYFSGVPALAVGLHLLGATLLWVAAVQLHATIGTEARQRTWLAVPGRSGTAVRVVAQSMPVGS